MADPFYKDLPDHPFREMPTNLEQSFSQSCGVLPELGNLNLFSVLDVNQPQADLVDESTRPPSPDNMKEINLARPELPNIDPNTVPDDLSKIEVIDEAPTDPEQPGTLSSCLSSGSADSITFTAAPGDLNIDAWLQEFETTETRDLPLQCPPKSPKRKPSTSEQAPVAKRVKPPLIPQEQNGRETARRKKKNEASRRSRASRKQKEQELFTKLKELLNSNTELKAQIEELTREKEALKFLSSA